ncbi:MAG: Polysaccharide biosynthesis protein [candidate division CPR1 bacterium GW2011_GWA2_42_17]|uniref:Polysaccharide biosynthesis protein n=1 Tax=candidate division CPR1 bacterium GW2011_GWA2_42_17 TaxID=1618341 RepID=A0A0G0YWY2_9BACT|nr:MAG: Polysaccharide biosynthesis protein [candidate division CPR1 bacterium GW2011_GWA2_42_17]
MAVLARSILGLIAIYIISPWKPTLSFNKQSFKSLVSFGVPFQLNSILGLVKDRLLVAYYGIVLPATQVGYLQWAERWSLFPLRIVVDNVNKVTFPAYSRLQGKKSELTKAIEKSLFFTALIIFPTLVAMNVLAPALIQIIPKYQKWQPALLALMLFSINGMWSSISTTLTNSFRRLGPRRHNFNSSNDHYQTPPACPSGFKYPSRSFQFSINGVCLVLSFLLPSSFFLLPSGYPNRCYTLLCLNFCLNRKKTDQ